MNLIPFLICFAFVVVVFMYVIWNNFIRIGVAYASLAVIMASVIWLLIDFISHGAQGTPVFVENEIVEMIILIAEAGLMFLVVYQCFVHKKYLISLLSIVQTLLIIWVEHFGPEITGTPQMLLDRLSLLMIVIVAFIGGMITIYAVGYMHGYHHYHTEFPDRRYYFFSLIFVFLGAMFGLVLSKSMLWMDFFWEITSICSFLLIGYTKTDEAVENSFRALWMNLLGGLMLAIGITVSAFQIGVVDLQMIVEGGLTIPIVCFVFAALTKSAQLPFSRWLLGAMVAPTPSSALLHSATMVKAGVYLLFRLSPALAGTMTGTMVSFIGGLTFLLASLLAISKSDAKAVLAYSTISNLGLIVACAGVGMPETIWAAIYLLIFHAVSKAMMFQDVGAVENSLHSRNIENMQGLIYRLPRLTFIMLIGIAGMYLAPFGMLIAKWAAFKAFVDASNPLLIIFIAFGSSTTMFYWTKWMAKIIGPPRVDTPLRDVTKKNEYASLYIHAVIMVVICLLCVPMSKYVVLPIEASLIGSTTMTLDSADIMVMVILLIAIVVLPFACYLGTKKHKRKHVISYMNGVNAGDNKNFIDSFGEEKQLYTANWYMVEYLGENKLLTPCIIVSAGVLIIMMCLIIGGAV